MASGGTHHFVQTTFTRPTYCNSCSEYIWSPLTNYQCLVCKSASHSSCLKTFERNCRSAFHFQTEVLELFSQEITFRKQKEELADLRQKSDEQDPKKTAEQLGEEEEEQVRQLIRRRELLRDWPLEKQERVWREHEWRERNCGLGTKCAKCSGLIIALPTLAKESKDHDESPSSPKSTSPRSTSPPTSPAPSHSGHRFSSLFSNSLFGTAHEKQQTKNTTDASSSAHHSVVIKRGLPLYCPGCRRYKHFDCSSTMNEECHPVNDSLFLKMLLRENDNNHQKPPDDPNSVPLIPPQKEIVVDYVESRPLIVFINTRSGGLKGKTLFPKFLSRLGPAQVFDMDSSPPHSVLELFCQVPNLRILVCGGDGSISWIMDEIQKLPFPAFPPIGILPLGTGNDLSRVLGWGGSYEGEQVQKILNSIADSNVVNLDRWKMEISTGQETRSLLFNNYFSLGIDAKVVLDFHRLRKEKPELCSTRAGNYFWYAVNGVAAVFSPIPISKIISLEIDGHQIAVDESLEGLIFLNVQSYSGGSDLWGTSTTGGYQRPAFDDGRLEVVGISGSFHMGTIQIKLGSARRVGQGTSFKITFQQQTTSSPSLDVLPMQVDGEPWEQQRAVITIHRSHQIRLLSKDPSVRGAMASSSSTNPNSHGDTTTNTTTTTTTTTTTRTTSTGSETESKHTPDYKEYRAD